MLHTASARRSGMAGELRTPDDDHEDDQVKTQGETIMTNSPWRKFGTTWRGGGKVDRFSKALREVGG
eukprot:750298-Hanusia_phi.AAC.1